MSQLKNLSSKYLINLDDYEVIKKINVGGFGIINLVRKKNTSKEYASKTNLIQTGVQSKVMVSREVRILIQIQHPTMIQFHGFSYTDFEKRKNITILMDYMKEGSLADLIKKDQRSLSDIKYDNTKRQIILIGIARGMMVLHEHHIIHRDLKPENILIDENYYPHITDFGLAKFFDPYHSMSQSIADTGTVPYMAPEVIEGDHFNTKADVYAFGILMYEVVTGKRAYHDLLKGPERINAFMLKKKVCEGYRPPIEKNSMKKWQKVMIEKCWSANPKERPNFSELFTKLSLLPVDEFIESEEEPSIIVDDQDEGEEDNGENEMIGTRKFCFDNVNADEIMDYVDYVSVDSASDEKSKLEADMRRIESQVSALQEELAASKSEALALKEEAERKNSQIESMSKKIQDQSEVIRGLKTELEEIKNGKLQSSDYFSAKLDMGSPGILENLRKRERTKFDRQFVASQSSGDIYNLIDPNTNDDFCTTCDHFFIEFELEESITINGIQIFSSESNFPKSFDIIIEGRVVSSIKNAAELNGASRNMTIKIGNILCRRIRIEQTGPSWDQNNNFLHIKRIELTSPEPKYATGVFSTLVNENESKDPHKARVHITSTNFDFNNFHRLDAPTTICTYPYEKSWFQIELTRTTAILNGFRFKRVSPKQTRSCKIICSDDVTKPISKWTTLISIDEKMNTDHSDPDIYEFERPSPPTRFIRLIQTGKNWGDNFHLQFYHFDLFGSLSLEGTIESNIKSISDIKRHLCRYFTNASNLEGPGILENLKKRERTKFDRQFVASQSSRDIYSLIDPNANDDFRTNNNGHFFIEFELEESVTINGIQIFSSESHFPKSFDIIIEGRVVSSIKDTAELNGASRNMTINIDSISCRCIRIEQTGPSWDQDDRRLCIKRVELISPEPKYATGVFSTLVNENESKDPHKARVHITSTNFNFNNFHRLDAPTTICTYDNENSWFQIELTRTTAILNGFRLKRYSPYKTRSYKIICSDDVTKPISKWTTLISIDEKTNTDHSGPDIYEFERPSPPTRFIRLIQTGKNWGDNFHLLFYHFDLFGSCF